jgi:hypothetical protein
MVELALESLDLLPLSTERRGCLIPPPVQLLDLSVELGGPPPDRPIRRLASRQSLADLGEARQQALEPRRLPTGRLWGRKVLSQLEEPAGPVVDTVNDDAIVRR